MATINIYAKGSDPKTATPKAVVSKLEYSGSWMESCTVTVTVNSPTPIDFAVGDFIIYRDEYFWIDNDANVKKSARSGYSGDGFLYENLIFYNTIRELQQCDFLDYVKHGTNKYTYSAASSVVFYASTVEDFANRLQANLDRLYTGDKQWQVLVDDNIKDRNKTFDGAGNKIIRDKTVSISNSKISDVLSEIVDTFKTTYTIRGRVLKIGFAAEDVTPSTATFEYYDEDNGERKGLVSLEKTINSQYAIITRLRAYGSERNMPSRYYANRYTTIHFSNEKMPRYCAISTVAGDGNTAIDFKGIYDGGSYICTYSNWFIKTNIKYPIAYEKVENGDYWIYVAKWGGLAKQMFPNPDNVVIRIESGDSDNHHTIITPKVQVVPWRDTTNRANAQNTNFYIGFKVLDITDEEKEAFTNVYATQDGGWSQESKNYPTIDSVSGFCSDAFDEEYKVYDGVADTTTLSIFNLMMPGFPTKSLQEYVYGVDGVGGSENLQEWIEQVYGSKDALNGHLSTDKFFPYIDSPNVDKYGIRESSIYFTEDNDDYDEIYPSIEAGYNGQEVNYFTFVDETGETINGSSGYSDQGVFDDDDDPPGYVGVKVPYAGFDWAFYWTDSMSLSMTSGMCAGREFSVMKVINIDGEATNGAILFLQRSFDESIQRYFPYKDYPLTPKSDKDGGDRFVILNIEMPSSYVESAAEVAFKQAISYLEDHDRPSYIYTPTLSSVYMQREHDAKVAEGKEGDSVWYKIKEGSAITFRDEDVLGGSETHIINTLSIRDGENMIPSYEITIKEDDPDSQIASLENEVKSLKTASYSSGTYSVKKNDLLSYLRKDIADTAEGKITFEQGLSVGENNSGYITADGNASLKRIDVNDKVTSPNFADGFNGYGFRLWEENGLSYLTLDKLTVRQTMSVFELLINKIRSVGGQICVSAANGKIKSVTATDEYYIITFEEASSFKGGDLMRCQTFNGGTLKSYWVEVTTADTTGEVVYVAKTEFGDSLPEAGDECVLMGNTSDTSRQNMVLISATEDGQPRVDVMNGISSKDKTFANALRARLGNLDGIEDEAFTKINLQPQGDGLYADNAFLKGTFVLTTGEDVKTRFEVTDAGVKSQVESVRDDLQSFDNYLTNPSFRYGLDKWSCGTEATAYVVDGKYVWANDNVLAHSGESFLEEDDNRNVIRLNNMYLLQENANMTNLPEGDHTEFLGVTLSFRYKCVTAGTLTAVLSPTDGALYASKEIAVTDGYETFTATGVWTGIEDLKITFTGEMCISMVSLSWDNGETVSYKYQTLFLQSDKLVNIASKNFDEEGNVLASSGIVTTTDLKAYVTTTDASKILTNYLTSKDTKALLDKKVDVASFASLFASAVDADSNIVKQATLSTYVTKDDEGKLESNVYMNADQITLKGGLFTANENFRVLEDGSMETKNARIGGYLYTTFRDVESSDATVLENNEYQLNTNLYVATSGGQGIVLPVSEGYEGARVIIMDTSFVRTRSSEPTKIRTADGSKIVSGLLVYNTSLTSTATGTKATADKIYIYGGTLEFVLTHVPICTSASPSTEWRWVLMNIGCQEMEWEDDGTYYYYKYNQ